MRVIRLLFIPIVFFALSLIGVGLVCADTVVFREDESDKSAKNEKVCYINDYFEMQCAWINKEEEPLITIPQDMVERVGIRGSICESFYLPFDLEIVFEEDVSKVFSNIVRNHEKKQIALFIDDELVALPYVLPFSWGGNSFVVSSFRFEKAASIILNMGLSPDYDNICIHNKKEMSELEKKYNFREKDDYVPSADSEFWITMKELEMYDNLDDKNVIKRIPKNKLMQQMYNYEKEDFERKGNYLEVIYENAVGWIRRDKVKTFFSTLSNDVFIQKYFENNEIYFSRRDYPSESLKRMIKVRNYYMNEAKARFVSVEQFMKWYQDTFNTPPED